MSISYANVVAKRQDSNPELPVEEQNGVTASTSTTTTTATTSDSEPVTADATETKAEPEAEASPKKEKKVLVPAPVPKSVWGETTPASTQAVDEQKWPTPDKVVEIEQSQQSASKTPAQKFIKPNKWVPINAKVVLPSPRNAQGGNGAGNQQKNKKKNKNARKNKVPATGAQDAKKEDDAVDSEEKPAATAEQSHDSILADANGQQSSYNYQNDSRQRYGAQQKNYKKFSQNGAVSGSQNRPQGQAQQQNRQQQGYYQTFNPQYQANNRQFRPVNGMNGAGFPRSNSNGNIGGHFAAPNGFRPMSSMPFVPLPQHPQQMMMPGMQYGAPMPVQIPPPISPKQNPEQALTSQIDYYFSLENLIRDVFLRKQMGTEGWVELDLILNFKRVKIITNGIKNGIEESDEQVKEDKLDKAILQAVQRCQNLEIGYLNGKEAHDAKATEVQLRVKHSFEQWLLPDN